MTSINVYLQNKKNDWEKNKIEKTKNLKPCMELMHLIDKN